jgi:hypothetical protein
VLSLSATARPVNTFPVSLRSINELAKAHNAEGALALKRSDQQAADECWNGRSEAFKKKGRTEDTRTESSKDNILLYRIEFETLPKILRDDWK